MDDKGRETLDAWNGLLERYGRGDATQEELALFVMGMDVMWRMLVLAHHERQTKALEALAAAVQRMAER